LPESLQLVLLTKPGQSQRIYGYLMPAKFRQMEKRNQLIIRLAIQSQRITGRLLVVLFKFIDLTSATSSASNRK
jgi:hypothetical protein